MKNKVDDMALYHWQSAFIHFFYLIANSQSNTANGVARRVLHIDISNIVYSTAMSSSRNMLMPMNTTAEYSQPSGNRCRRCSGKHVPEYVA